MAKKRKKQQARKQQPAAKRQVVEEAEVASEPKTWGDRMVEQLNAWPLMTRILAFIIDFICGAVATVAVIALPYYFMTGGKTVSTLSDYLEAGVAVHVVALLVLVALFFSWCYYVLIPTRVWPGQTLGKHLGGLEMVMTDGSIATIDTLTARWFVMLIAETPFMAVTSYVMQLGGLAAGNTVLSAWQMVGIAGSLISLVMMIRSKDHRALHDRVAGTWVYSDN